MIFRARVRLLNNSAAILNLIVSSHFYVAINTIHYNSSRASFQSFSIQHETFDTAGP